MKFINIEGYRENCDIFNPISIDSPEEKNYCPQTYFAVNNIFSELITESEKLQARTNLDISWKNLLGEVESAPGLKDFVLDQLTWNNIHGDTTITESLGGDEVIIVNQDGENKAVKASTLIKGAKEIIEISIGEDNTFPKIKVKDYINKIPVVTQSNKGIYITKTHTFIEGDSEDLLCKDIFVLEYSDLLTTAYVKITYRPDAIDEDILIELKQDNLYIYPFNPQGNGNCFLSDDGTYKEVPSSDYDDTEIKAQIKTNTDAIAANKVDADSKLTELGSKQNIGFIASPNVPMPNIVTESMTLDLGDDPIIVVGGVSYVMKSIHTDTSIYRNIPLFFDGSTSGAIKLVFNLESKTILPKIYTYTLAKEEVVFGAVRLSHHGGNVFKFISADFPFKFRVNGVEFSSKENGLTDNFTLNNIVKELYVLDNEHTYADVKSITRRVGYELNGKYLNTLYVNYNDGAVTPIGSNSYDTLEEAILEEGIISYSGSYAVVVATKEQVSYEFVCSLNRPTTLEFCPTIKSYLMEIEQEKANDKFEKAIEKNEGNISELQQLTLDRPELFYNINDFTDGYYVVANKIGNKPNAPVAVTGYAYMYHETDEGDEWEMKLKGGSNGRAWALLDEEGIVVDFSQETGLKDYSVTIPKGVVTILFNTSYSGSDKGIQYVKRKKKESVISKQSTYIESEVLVWDENKAQKTNIGELSEQADYSGYRSVKVENLQKGDKIEYVAIGGSSYRAWAKISKGIVIETATSSFLSGVIDCDGTFDAVVLNYYYHSNLASGNPEYAKVTKTKSIRDLVKDVQKNKDDVKELQQGSIRRLKVLCFGNSFTEDSMGYVPYILKKIAPELKITIGMARIGGCPLAQHLASFTNTTQSLDGVDYQFSNYSYIKSVDGSSWVVIGSKSPDDIIKDDDWDIVTFQQNGTASASDYDTYYAPFIYKLHKALFDKVSNRIKIGWILTHGAYVNNYESSVEKWEGTANNAKRVMEETGTSILFPFGTAVQNLRTTSLKTIGDGNGALLMADGAHLQEGIGCLVAAYTNSLAILKCVGMENVGVIGDTTRISSELLAEINMPGQNLGTNGVVGITDDNCYLAQVAAECALKNPYEVTDLKPL